MENNFVVIMAGGVGSRFWPFSRERYPKQFQDILGVGKTMIQQTAERFDGICPREHIYVVTSSDYYDLVKEQLPFLSDDQILCEPMRRNTAPCIAYACHKIECLNPHANIVVSPADHVITDVQEFRRLIALSLEHTATNDILVTLGIRPSRPDTGYGYIQFRTKEVLGELFKVKTFTEKPNFELAQAFVASGDYYWNAGIFVWNAKAIRHAFAQQLPDIEEAFADIRSSFFTPQEPEDIKRAYYQCRSISIDFGIMEHAQNVYVMRSDFGWSDLGTWKSLYEQAEKDRNENAVQGDVLAYESRNCIIKAPADRLVVVQGLNNYIVAEYDNVLLICQKDEEQRIKQFVEDVKEKKGPAYY